MGRWRRMAAPDPFILRPLRIMLAVLGLVLLVTLVATGVSSCHHAGWV